MSTPAPLQAVLRRQLNNLVRQRQRRLPTTRRTHSTTTSSSSPAQQKASISTTAQQLKPQEGVPPLPATVAAPPPPPPPAPTSIWQRLGPVTRAGEAYARAQRRRPYVMQTAATLVIYFAGDVLAQYIGMDDTTTNAAATTITTSTISRAQTSAEEESKQPPSFLSQYDPLRTLRSMSIGGLAAIPGWHWFLFLSNNFNYPSRAASIFLKVAINQALFTPLFNTYFFGAHSLLSGATPAEAWERIQRAVPVSMLNSVKLWPAVTAFSFAFIPIEFRSLFAGGIAIGWQAYLSALNKRAAEAARLAAAEAGGAGQVKGIDVEEELVGAARVAAAC